MLAFLALVFNILAAGALFELTSGRSRVFSRDLAFTLIQLSIVCYVLLVFNFGWRLGEDFREYEHKYTNINSIALDEGSLGFNLLMRLVSALVSDSATGIALIVIIGQLIYLLSLRSLADLRFPIFAALCFLVLFNRLVFEVSLNTIRSNLAFVMSIWCLAVTLKNRQDTRFRRVAIGVVAGALLSYLFHPLSSIVFLGLMVIAGVLWRTSRIIVILLAIGFTTYLLFNLGKEVGFSERFQWIGLILLENELVGTVRDDVTSEITFSLWVQVASFVTLPVIAAEMSSSNIKENILRASARAGMVLSSISLLLSTELAIRVCYLTIPIAITQLLSIYPGRYRRVVLVWIAGLSAFGGINLISRL
jgi:hypothetical protein